jgi:hypothetical protein
MTPNPVGGVLRPKEPHVATMRRPYRALRLLISGCLKYARPWKYQQNMSFVCGSMLIVVDGRRGFMSFPWPWRASSIELQIRNGEKRTRTMCNASDLVKKSTPV